MKLFIAYFDFLGYKDFIFNNSSEHLKKRAGHILRDIEIALSTGNYQEPKGGVLYSDLSISRINCLNISDTIIFWTLDNTIESLEELLMVAHRFNWQEILYNMPIRGTLYYDEFEMLSGKQKNNAGAIYSANLIYGMGLVQAHLKSESLNWAGTVIDNTVLQELSIKVDVESFLKPYAKKYMVPYKSPPNNQTEEYVLHINSGGLNEEAYKNTRNNIVESFSRDNKSVKHPRVQEILNNTISFLNTYRD